MLQPTAETNPLHSLVITVHQLVCNSFLHGSFCNVYTSTSPSNYSSSGTLFSCSSNKTYCSEHLISAPNNQDSFHGWRWYTVLIESYDLSQMIRVKSPPCQIKSMGQSRNILNWMLNWMKCSQSGKLIRTNWFTQLFPHCMFKRK